MIATSSRRQLMWGIVLCTYWVALFLGTHLPLSGTGMSVPGSDKVIHAVAYTVLAILLAGFVRVAEPRGREKTTLVLLILAAYAGVDELSQYLVPSRSPELGDWTADLVGSVLGVATFVTAGMIISAFANPRRKAAPAEPDQ